MTLRLHVPLSLFPPITQAQADDWFDVDFAQALRGCERIFGLFWPGIGDARKGALIDMCFELGENGLYQFHKMIALVFQGKWSDAADEARQSLWARQVPERAEEDEALLRVGDWRTLVSMSL